MKVTASRKFMMSNLHPAKEMRTHDQSILSLILNGEFTMITDPQLMVLEIGVRILRVHYIPNELVETG